MSTCQRLRRNFGISLKGFSQLIQVDLIVFNAIQWRKSLTAHERQASIEGQVATLAVDLAALAGASALSLGTPAGSLALSCGNTTPDAFSIFLAARIGHEIM
jgi:hypothetical protein